MKICIVGGTGNISSSFIPLLLHMGHEVTLFNRGQREAAPKGVATVQIDRSDRTAFEQAAQRGNFDAAIDMICFNKEDAQSSLRAFSGVKHFVMCSTVCTYGIDYDWLPVTEDHPLRPITDYGRNKVAADAVFLEAYYKSGFPVTIIKPSTTYGPKMGLLRQVAWDFTWIDRVRKGMPIVVCGDGNALHQFLHVDDAALCFCNVLGRQQCIGQTYNMVNRGFYTWTEYHKTAMKVIGKEVELVNVAYADLEKMDVASFGICKDIFAHHVYYSSEKLFRDVPEFSPQITLEKGMAHVLEAMDRQGRVPDCSTNLWEDRVIAAQRRVRGN
jgi:nucleoside-diphosphate-sugar epimerase